MTIANKGNVYITGDGITVFSKTGEKIAHIPLDKGRTANIWFTDHERDMLFIITMDSVFGLKMNISGAAQ